MSPHLAEQLKQKGNSQFNEGNFDKAAVFYSQAIQQYSSNPLLYTNRANARLKLGLWSEVIDDCLRSIELEAVNNMKAYYFLAQAQFELRHPNEALTSAITAYDICSRSLTQTSSAFAIATFVIKCKRAKWDLRERDRLRRRSALLSELESHLTHTFNNDLSEVDQRQQSGELGTIGATEEKDALTKTHEAKISELRSIFAIADPGNMAKREVPEYLIDAISFEIMHDPVITKNGQSYERATIIEHLKRNPTDPLSREPLYIPELRPNLALKKACDDFWEGNHGWAYDCGVMTFTMMMMMRDWSFWDDTPFERFWFRCICPWILRWLLRTS
ncbi:U-box-domain-containing protein [Tothia fuscella]|uniref:U-box-domain-containing protein n=1 Tax=Tothia fuscella TaxID=1048955 RepID=A0A9P4NYP5_9PEZI|nr:U-box-domain-containing protein [Tothia fuscella]